MTDVEWIIHRAISEWIQFIVLKNIDPVVKTRFVHSIDYLIAELNKMKQRLENNQDGTIGKNVAE